MFLNWLFSRRHRAASTPRTLLQLEALETRVLPAATVTVNAAQVVRPVNNQVLGVNVAWWDSSLNTTQTQQMVQAAGLTMFRFPGGSSSDTWHFNAGPTYGGEGMSPSMAGFIASVGGTGMVTLNYGTGSPQEAAAFLAYLNAPVGNTTAIGSGEEWNTTTNTWVQQDWKTAGYWAGLRAAAPLAQDDGLNFLRIGRSAPFAFHYYEVGNEEYGNWETDYHGQGGDTGVAHDPATYVAFAKQFARYAAQIDPTISIGEDTGSLSYDNNWTPNVLQQDANQGFIPGFLSDHNYVQAPNSESDSNLLLNTVSNPNGQSSGSPYDWALRASGYRGLLNQYLGANATKVELLATEFNSVYSNPGKQTTSLVNGLFVADSLGSLLQTEYNGADVWDLRNGFDTSDNNSSSLYGWRQGGDYGLLGSGSGPAPSTGTYVPYPTYFAEQLVSKMVHTGDTVVQASGSDPNLSVYAVKEANGHLDSLVINKSATSNLTGQFQVAGFTPNTQAQFWQYGEAEDTAQSQTSDGHSALTNFNATLALSGANFNYTFPSYSMTVVDLTPQTSTSSATSFTLTAPSSTTAGTAANLTLTAYDASGDVASGYTGTVHLTSSDTQASLPGDYTFTSADAGMHTFSVTLKTAGNQTVTAKDTANGTLTATTAPAIAVSPGAASRFQITAPGSVTAGTATNVTVTVQDAYGNTVTGYTGKVHFTSTDKKAALPSDYTFTSGDQGVHAFTGKVTLKTAGAETFTATDKGNAAVTGTSPSIQVAPAAAASIGMRTSISSITAGKGFNVTLTVVDGYGNTATGYTGTVHFTSTDTRAVLPADYTFSATDAGVHTFKGVVLDTAGSNSITATDTAKATIKGTVPAKVSAAAASSLVLIGPTSVTSGTAFSFTLKALDAFGNVATGYRGKVHFTSSDGSALLPSDYTFTSSDGGLHAFTATLKRKGTQWLAATDTVTASLTVTQSGISVN